MSIYYGFAIGSDKPCDVSATGLERLDQAALFSELDRLQKATGVSAVYFASPLCGLPRFAKDGVIYRVKFPCDTAEKSNWQPPPSSLDWSFLTEQSNWQFLGEDAVYFPEEQSAVQPSAEERSE